MSPRRKLAAGPIRLVITAHKGGVGKTTAAVNLAGAFAEVGRRTLLVDVDPQGAAGAGLGLTASKPTLFDVLMGNSTAAEAIVPSGFDNLDVLPADLDLAGAEISLPRLSGWQTRLREALATVDAAYSVVVLDSAPGLAVVPFIALVAGDCVLITATPTYYTLRALPHLVAATEQARVFNGGLRVLGLVPSIVGGRTLHRDEALAEFVKRWPGWTLPALPRRVAFEDAAAAGVPITSYAPRSASATAVRALALEVLHRAAS